MTHELLYTLALPKIPSVGAITAKNLISYCGSAEAVFRATQKELLAIPSIGPHVVEQIKRQAVLHEAELELTFVEKNNIEVLLYTDKSYPHRLKHYPDSPLALFWKGNAPLNHYRIVAIVGTRQPTPYGQRICEELVNGLFGYDVLIISGLAYGIDITAHRKCVELGMPTIGVLGHGLSQIYPAAHRAIASQMMEKGGLLTEYHHKEGPDREHFPMRNRVIAGMCDALIVVETASSGGSIISAEFANSYNKDVFAIPGRANEPFSKGCNELIKFNKATLAENASDIARHMRWEELDHQKTVQSTLFVEMNPTEKMIFDLLQQSDGMQVDMLTYESKLSSSMAAAVLLDMEFKGLVRSLPGKRYVLV
jgi:DNA processing protein